MYIYSNAQKGILYVESSAPIDTYRIYDKDGVESQCPKLKSEQKGDVCVTTFDVSSLSR